MRFVCRAAEAVLLPILLAPLCGAVSSAATPKKVEAPEASLSGPLAPALPEHVAEVDVAGRGLVRREDAGQAAGGRLLRRDGAKVAPSEAEAMPEGCCVNLPSGSDAALGVSCDKCSHGSLYAWPTECPSQYKCAASQEEAVKERAKDCTNMKDETSHDCSTQLEEWAGADDCAVLASSTGTCKRYCSERNRTCVKAHANKAQQDTEAEKCVLDDAVEEALEENGCMQDLPDQICVCGGQAHMASHLTPEHGDCCVYLAGASCSRCPGNHATHHGGMLASVYARPDECVTSRKCGIPGASEETEEEVKVARTSLGRSCTSQGDAHLGSTVSNYCGHHGEDYTWCNTATGWDYCVASGETAKGLLCMNDGTEGSHCHPHKDDKFLWCYTAADSWDYCVEAQEPVEVEGNASVEVASEEGHEGGEEHPEVQHTTEEAAGEEANVAEKHEATGQEGDVVHTPEEQEAKEEEAGEAAAAHAHEPA